MNLNDMAFSWGVTSGIVLVGLGVLALGRRRVPMPGIVAFAIFSILWGLQVLAIHVATFGRLADPETLTFVAVGLLSVLPILLWRFAYSFARVGMPNQVWQVSGVALVLTCLASLFLLLRHPDLLYQGTEVYGARAVPIWGPAMPILVNLPLFATFVVVLVALERARRRVVSPRVAGRLFYLMAGLSLYVSYNAGSNAVIFIAEALRGGAVSDILHAGLFALVVGMVAALAFAAVAGGRPGSRHGMAGLMLAGPACVGVLEGFLVVSVWPALNVVGLWRVAGLTLVAFGLELWRAVPTPRTPVVLGSWSAVPPIIAGVCIALWLVPAETVELPTLLVGGVTSAAWTGVPLWLARRGTLRFADPPSAPFAVDRAYGNRIEAYRAALELSVGQRSLDQDRRFLTSLREQLGLGDAEHRLLLHLAAETTVPVHRGHVSSAYERLRLLGEGGNGRTWLARDRARDCLVVIKEPLSAWHQDRGLAESIRREARLAAKVRHRNVVHIIEVVDEGDRPLIIMEYVAGGTLENLLASGGPLSWPQARDILVDVLAGLVAVHAAGVIHRDIKPSNILIDSSGQARVADFGIAIPVGTGQTRVDPSSVAAGSPGYMAPEVAGGKTPGDERTDIYACGAVLFECLAGRPWPGRDGRAPSLPSAVQDLVVRAMEQDPEQRFPDARSFLLALQDCDVGGPGGQ